MKANCLVYGNCQGSWLYHMLKQELCIQEKYHIFYFPNYGEREEDHPALKQDFWTSDTLFICQVAPNSPELPFKAFMSSSRQLRYPTLWGKMLWPFNVSDPRNHPEEGLPFGRFFYGDRLIVKWLNEGLDATQIVERYLNEDISKHIKIARYVEMCFAEMRFIDKQSDIIITPFIESSFRQYKLFGSINHPSYLLLDYILTHVKAWIQNTSIPEQWALPENASDILGDEEIPIHPQIIDELKLEWAWPEMRYHYRSNMINFAEYVKSYANFDLIPAGSPPSLWIDRADQAFQSNQPEEAKRLLRAGLIEHPEEPALYQTLTALLTEEKDFTQAFILLSRALTIPNLDNQMMAQLHNNLGIIHYYQGAIVQAQGAFQTALQLEPNWQEASDNLQEVTHLTA